MKINSAYVNYVYHFKMTLLYIDILPQNEVNSLGKKGIQK